MCCAEELERAQSIIELPWKNPALVLTSKRPCLSCDNVAECYSALVLLTHAEKQLSSLISTWECHSKWETSDSWKGWVQSEPIQSIILQPINFPTTLPFNLSILLLVFLFFFYFFYMILQENISQNLWLFYRTVLKIMWRGNHGRNDCQFYFVCSGG